MFTNVGGNIRILRQRRGYSQEKLSELAGINAKYLGEIERGEKNPTALVVYKIASALHVSMCEFFPMDICPLVNHRPVAEVLELFAERQDKN
jgi:transcriptional regulator with XRE-family HTH domain